MRSKQILYRASTHTKMYFFLLKWLGIKGYNTRRLRITFTLLFLKVNSQASTSYRLSGSYSKLRARDFLCLQPNMTCANRSESRGGSGSSRSCSCGGACLSSSLRFVSSDGRVEMKWGTSSSCALQSLQDGSPRTCPLLCELNLQTSDSRP